VSAAPHCPAKPVEIPEYFRAEQFHSADLNRRFKSAEYCSNLAGFHERETFER
jgi:hypothetical protein